MTVKEFLQKLVTDDKIDEAMQILLNLIPSSSSEGKEAIMNNARLASYKHNKRNNLVDGQELKVEIANIRFNTLHLIDSLPENILMNNIGNMNNESLQQLVKNLYAEYQEKQEFNNNQKNKAMDSNLIDGSVKTFAYVIEKIKDGAFESLGLPVATHIGKFVRSIFSKKQNSEKLIENISSKAINSSEQFQEEIIELAKQDVDFGNSIKQMFKDIDLATLKEKVEDFDKADKRIQKLRGDVEDEVGIARIEELEKLIEQTRKRRKKLYDDIQAILSKRGIDF